MPENATVADRILSLSFEIDESSNKNTLAKIQSLRTGLNTLAVDTKKLSLTTSGLSNDYGKLSAKAVEARNQLLKGTSAMKEQITVADRLRQAQAATASGRTAGGSLGNLRTAGRAASTVGQLSSLAGIDNEITRVGSAASQAAPLLEALGASEAVVATATPIVGAALIALAVAIKVATDAVEEGKKRVSSAVEGQKTYYELLQTGTKESIALGLQELKVKLAVAEATRRDIQAAKDNLKENNPVADLLDFVTNTTGGELDKLDSEIAALNGQLNAYTKASQSQAVATNTATAAIKEQTAATQKQADAQKAVIAKTREDIRAVQDQAAKDEAAILQRAADQRIQIAQRTAEAEADALTNLQRSLAEGRIKLSQDQADTRLNYQRGEEEAAQAHYRTLKQIRKDAQDDEFELQLNRDFAGIAALRRQTDKRLTEEDDKYVQERTQRLTALRHQLGDQQKAFIREREARNRAYQQQLIDLRTVQNRQIKANAEAAQVEMDRLHAKLKAELAMKQDALSIELQMLTNFVNRVKALTGEKVPTTQINANQGHEQQHTGTGGYAGGGFLPSMKTVEVNERGRESYTMGGKTMWLPNARGYFTPTQGGTVNPAGGGGASVSIGDIIVNGATLSEIRRNVHKIVDTKLAEAFEAITS